MANNSKHNKFVSIPDWFGMSNSQVETPTAPVKTTSVVASGGSVSSSMTSNLIYYNKFALSAITADSSILTLNDTAIYAAIPEGNDESSIGDLTEVTGWKTSEYIPIAAQTTINVKTTSHHSYGMVFYNNTKTVINGIVFSTDQQEVTSPANAYYYRICSLSDTFEITYFEEKPYTSDELELSNQNISDYLKTDETIPEGLNNDVVSLNDVNLVVQRPLSLSKDINSVLKLSLDVDALPQTSENEMFEWDKSLAAFGYNSSTNSAYKYIGGVLQQDSNGNPLMTEDKSFWQYDEELSDKWIIRSVKSRLSLLDGLMEYDQDKDCFMFHKNIVTSGGITMYADLGDVNVPDLAESLPLDGKTIWYNPDTKQIEVLIKEQEEVGGGLTEVLESGEGNAYTGRTLSEDGKTLTLIKGQTFLTIDDLPDYTDMFVTLDDTEQYIIGTKHFTNGIYIGDKKLYQSQDDVIYLDANLVVRGGVTMYATDGNVNVDSIYDGLPIDQDTIYWDESTGEKVLKAKASGGTIESINTIGSGNALTLATLANDGKSIQFTKGETFAKLSELTTLQDNITALQTTVATKADKSYVDDNFVTIQGEDTITGKKNFKGGLLVNDNEIVWDKSKSCWKLEGNLVVTGGITMYSSDYESGGNSGITELPIASTTELGIASFDASSFTVTDGHVNLNTKIVISDGTPSSYNTNTLYIIT